MFYLKKIQPADPAFAKLAGSNKHRSDQLVLQAGDSLKAPPVVDWKTATDINPSFGDTSTRSLQPLLLINSFGNAKVAGSILKAAPVEKKKNRQ
ncbi:MAG TPA: hypothetical protein VFV31_08480 [Chitinophagaceae bacterium]|nr:hypothetical protein [Chitinophagaceae bacterium]